LILIKKGNQIELIEVKAKSFDDTDDSAFLNKNGTIKSNWRPYLHDIAFQKYVLTNAYKNFSISAFLMMANKNAKCATSGLNQKFKIVRADNRKGIEVSKSLTEEDLNHHILIKVPVDDEINLIYSGLDLSKKNARNFVEEIHFLSEMYKKNEKIKSDIGSKCAECEFKCSESDEKIGLKSGFKECWSEQLGWSDQDFSDDNVLSIWNFRKKDQLIAIDKIKISDLDENDINPKPDKQSGISASERQWLQIQKVKEKSTTPYFDSFGFMEEMKKWKYPLHFIDFETTAVALPFTKGRRPYEGIAFQFSHHILYADGRIEHAGEYLNSNVGDFPNYQFVRELKKQLESDDGTIFRYAPHENTYLNFIYRQLLEDEEDIFDREDLCQFIKSITTSVESSAEVWEGPRKMVDMWHLVKRYYYDPYTKGSNSIKYVLPAILNSSTFLQEKYSRPIYGSSKGVKSLNFKDWQWIEIKNGEVINPYKRLPKLFADTSQKNIDLLSEQDELNNGGAALTAYGKLQFTEISDYERSELRNALLKYCELDTLAMVMIFEGWMEMISSAKKSGKAA